MSYDIKHLRQIVFNNIIDNLRIKIKIVMCYYVPYSHSTFPIYLRIIL